ncbi:MAG: type II CAAX endopeptidase family protein [Actinomycetota bacterium]|nr:type II CAAX endopeptidase family protein [Actinomycetota bacterium]
MSDRRYKKSNVPESTGVVLDVKWNARDAIISLVFVTVVLVAVYFGSAWLFKVFGGIEFFNSSNISNASFVVFYVVQIILMLGVVWFFAIFKRQSGLRDLGLRYYSILKTIWYSFISLVAIFIVRFLYYDLLLYTLFGIEAPSSKIEVLIKSGNVSINTLMIIVALIAPLSEEIFFRGFLYQAFKKNWGVNAGLFLSSFLFAAVHFEIYRFIPIMIIGWLLAYLFEKTKSLLPAIFLHGVYNLALIMILLVQLEIIKLY